MEVYLIPVGSDRYELYCEVSDEAPDSAPTASRGFVRGLLHRFRVTLATVERERLSPRRDDVEPRQRGWRVRDRVLCWLAEKVAEQRLLWHLRRQERATAVFPEDLPEDRALDILKGGLRRDADRHRLWLIVDAVGLIGSVLLILVPGPNLVAYYFAFRVVGHYLSMRGARQGLLHIEWEARPSAPLTELRQAIALAPAQRERQIQEIASRLHLEHLVTFFQRTALPSA